MRAPLLVLALGGCPWIGADRLAARLDADGDGVHGVDVGGEDCDDTRPDIGPGKPERCNGLDDDCDGEVDEGLGMPDGLTVYADTDGDGFGDLATAELACAAPGGFTELAGDCDDGDSDVFPGAPERCNGLDDDCDGQVDEGASGGIEWFADADRDGFGDPDDAIVSCLAPEGYVADASDCDDTDDELNPLTPWYIDGDGDGYGDQLVLIGCQGPPGAVRPANDCDDADDEVHPGAAETCTSGDTDCDGLTADDDPDATGQREWYADDDGDDYGRDDTIALACAQPDGYAASPGDCDDTDPSAYPTAHWHVDADGDGYGGPVTVQSCEQPGGTFAESTDCDDGDPDVNPGATEVCDAGSTDEDCDGLADDLDDAPVGTVPFWRDDDDDGWGAGAPVMACDPPSSTFVAIDGDCDDGAPQLHPETEWFVDSDGDSFGDEYAPSVVQCLPLAGHSLTLGDCDDADDTTYPGAPEFCDDTDSDCDGALDDPEATGQRLWLHDGDGDGHGDDGDVELACLAPPDHVLVGGDCDDADPLFHPEAADACYDGIDHDCRSDNDDDCDDDGFEGIPAGGDDCDDNDPGVYPGVLTERRVPTEYVTIQAAVDASCPNDTVRVASGTFPGTVSIDKPLSLVGDGPDLTYVDGTGIGPVVSVTAGVTIEDLAILNGAGPDTGCLYIDSEDLVTVRSVDLAVCSGDQGSAAYALASLVVMEDVQVFDSWGDGAPVTIVSAIEGSALRGMHFDRLTGSTAGGLSLVAGTIELDGLTFLDTYGVNVGALGSYGASGNWSNLVIDGSTATAHSGIALFNVLGLPEPLVLDNVEIIEPTTAFVSAGLYVEDAVDLTIRDLRIYGGEPPIFPPAPSTVFVGTDGGTVALEQLQLVKTRGPVTLIQSFPADTLLLSHSTLSHTEGLICSGMSSGMTVSHVSITDSRGDGMGAFGSCAVDHVNAYGSAGIDFTDNGLLGSDGNISVPPGYVAAGPSLPAALFDLRLAASSLLRDAGNVGIYDPDGSTADIGAFGGPSADPAAYDDLDADGMLDTWELRFAIDDPDADPDADTLSNIDEFMIGTIPTQADTDGDGVTDDLDAAPLDSSAS